MKFQRVKTTKLFGVRRRIWRVRRSVPRIARPLSRVLLRSIHPSARSSCSVVRDPDDGVAAGAASVSRPVLLRQSEGHILWDEFHHPSERGWDSDALTAADITTRARVRLRRDSPVDARLALRRQDAGELPPRHVSGRALSGHLLCVPPTASSGQRELADGGVGGLRPRFVKYRLPEPLTGLGPLSGNLWSFALVPGVARARRSSRSRRSAPASTWRATKLFSKRDETCRDRVGSTSPTARPRPRAGRRARAHLRPARVDVGERARAYASGLAQAPAATSLTEPRPEKWRDQNPNAIERILPLVAEIRTAARVRAQLTAKAT